MISVGSSIESYSPYRIPQSSFPRWKAWATTPTHTSYPETPPQGSSKQYGQIPHAQRYRIPANMEPNNPDEMEVFQRLSDQYQPDVQGPLVGAKLPMNVLVREYAQADPRFVAKTESLAATHTAYRPIKGDGQCGWRAAVFGYFEVLLQSGDLQKIELERTRLKAFDSMMQAAGIPVDMLEDMFDCSYELLDRIKAAIGVGDRTENTVLQAMNNEGDSSCILYHFKSMTSGFMQLNLNSYEPFLEMSMTEYRQQRIDPANQEIDQVGLQALTDGVIAPAGIALDVSYLDRSMGDEVTPHPFVPNAVEWPTIRLLYRPGHYDMLYQDVQTIQLGQPIEVNMLSHVDNYSEAYYLAQPTPGDIFAMLSPNASVWQDPISSAPYQQPQNHTVPMPTSFTNIYPDQHPYAPATDVNPMEEPIGYMPSWSNADGSNVLPAAPSPVPPIMTTPPREECTNEPKIRRNNYSLLVHNHPFPSLEVGLPPGSSSTSHFNDANFEPEQYKPDVPLKKQKKASP